MRYRSAGGHPYTGLLAAESVPGLIRFSLARPPGPGNFTPGTALKLYVEGGPSANALFLGERTGTDGQQPDRNFFAQAFTNILPKPRALLTKTLGFFLSLKNRGNALALPIDPLAERGADGAPVASPSAPYRLLLKPVEGLRTASDSRRDFREDLAGLKPGPLFEVHASAGPGQPAVPIGVIEAESGPVASAYGDRVLFFRHPRGRPRPSASR